MLETFDLEFLLLLIEVTECQSSNRIVRMNHYHLLLLNLIDFYVTGLIIFLLETLVLQIVI